MSAKVHVQINDNPRAMLQGYQPGDRLVTIGAYFDVEAETEAEALDALWVIGNREGADLNGQRWPSGVRSVSVGDVIRVNLVTRTAAGVRSAMTAHSVDTIGFTKIEPNPKSPSSQVHTETAS